MALHPLVHALVQVERSWRSEIVGSSGFVVGSVSRVGSFTLSVTLLSVVPMSLNLPMKSWWGRSGSHGSAVVAFVSSEFVKVQHA